MNIDREMYQRHEDSQVRAFPRAVSTQECVTFARLDRERQIVDGNEFTPFLGETLSLDDVVHVAISRVTAHRRLVSADRFMIAKSGWLARST
jgi:hypothetical protein